MRALNNRPRLTRCNHKNWLTYTFLSTAVITFLAIFFHLYSVDWGLKIDLRKLGEAFTINGQPTDQHKTPSKTSAYLNPYTLKSNTQEKKSNKESYYIAPSGMRPIDYDIQLKLFNNIFIRHKNCDPQRMAWTQMDCSNFRARAMKRFNNEWGANSYWDGKKIVENHKADARVNSEI